MEMMLNKIVPEGLPYRHSCEGPDDMVSDSEYTMRAMLTYFPNLFACSLRTWRPASWAAHWQSPLRMANSRWAPGRVYGCASIAIRPVAVNWWSHWRVVRANKPYGVHCHPYRPSPVHPVRGGLAPPATAGNRGGATIMTSFRRGSWFYKRI